MVSISCRNRVLLGLVLCSFACVAVGNDDDEVMIAFKKLRGIPNSQAGLEVLEIGEHEVGPSWISVQGPTDLKINNKPLDHIEAKPEAKKTWAVILKRAEMTGTVEDNTTKATPANTTASASPPPPSPKESKNSPAKLPPAGGRNATSVSPPPVSSTGDEKRPPPTRGEACDHGPVIGTLVPAAEEDGHHDFTLTVANAAKSSLNVTIATLNGWKATPRGLTLSKGHNKSVKVSATDNEATKHEAKITLTWSNGDCHVDIPAQNLVGDVEHSSYSAFLSAPGTAALLLGGSLVFLLVLGVAGVWGCISWRAAGAGRHGDAETKYQELEMALPSGDAKQGGDEGSPSAEGWDEVWEDDDWQDNEAVRASSTALALSSAGLNSRRANKDGWDSSWDD